MSLRISVLLLLLASPAAALAQDPRVDELERKVDALVQEIESLKSGPLADTSGARPSASLGLSRGAAKVYSARGVSIGGYGEMLYENFDRVREDETLAGATDRIDFLRQVLYLGYKFNDALLFNSEIELEHAGVSDEATVEGQTDLGTGAVAGQAELSGEVVLEFAYLDWAFRRELGARAGMLLVPVGLVNEMHEPVTFFGAQRPEVERRIIPSTWSANGAGIYGELAEAVSYRAYLIEGLDAVGFGPTGIRGGRQSGSQSLATKPALVARIDWVAWAGVMAGASVLTGDTWQGAQTGPRNLDARLTLWDAHLRAELGGLELRALFARGSLDQSGDLSIALGLPGGSWLGSAQQGGYVEAGYDLVPWLRPGGTFRLIPYARFERLDTQIDAADGLDAPSLDLTVVTAGAALQPHPGVILKVERQQRSNRAETETSQWNVALGYSF